MPKITKIEEQKKRTDRFNVFLDDQYSFAVSEGAILEFDLYKGRELTEAEIEKIKAGDSISKCLDKAYRFLSYRARSEKEMRDKLAEKFDEGTVEEAIKRLKKFNLVNDAEFARAWINSRLLGRSKRALAFELKQKGVTKEVIEAALEDISKDDEFEAALALVKKRSKYQNLTGNEAYQKIGGFLSRRGYSYEIIKNVIEKVSK